MESSTRALLRRAVGAVLDSIRQPLPGAPARARALRDPGAPAAASPPLASRAHVGTSACAALRCGTPGRDAALPGCGTPAQLFRRCHHARSCLRAPRKATRFVASADDILGLCETAQLKTTTEKIDRDSVCNPIGHKKKKKTKCRTSHRAEPACSDHAITFRKVPSWGRNYARHCLQRSGWRQEATRARA